MSKRPKTATGVMSRLRRPADRLRDLPIWSKLGLIMLVPTLATIIVGVSGLVDHIDTASNAERARNLSALSEAAGGLVDRLQNERAYGVMIKVYGKTPVGQAAATAYLKENAATDQAKVPYSQQKASLDDVPPKVATLLLRLDRNLEELPAKRTSIAKGQLGQPADVASTYDILINDLLTVRDISAQLSSDSELADHLRTVAAVARAKEYVAEQRDLGHEVLGVGDFNPALRQRFLLTVAGFDLASGTIHSIGTDAEVQLFERIDSVPDGRAATNLTVQLKSLQGANTRNIPYDAPSWEKAMIGYNNLFRQVEQKLDSDVVAEATNLRNDVNRRVFIETSVLLAMLLLAILFAWLVARSMARSLRELRQGALSVAQFGLPHAVSRLRDPALATSLTPAQVADQIAEPLPVRSRDEFGQVTEAFNAVHLEAVRTAAEQAALRASVATMFVNLARRSQILVDRLIGHLDRLERGEEDPDRLAELFQLDHLATRMRRNDENLLVLAGADSTRVQREPAALIDVLRAAQSEVEHYTRIEFGMIDRDIEVAAHAVNDMVHLVAELFDNATAFSPPNSTVTVEARRLGDGALLSVEDRGIGISREQLRDLNERLANPPMVDVAVSRMMGLVVVARLANRHGVKVELRPADSERGTVAEVGLPVQVLIAGAMAGRSVQSGGYESLPQGGRPGLPEPLALESGGRGGYPGGRPFDPNPPMNNGGMLGAGGRSVPAWSDLTGAPGNGGNGMGGNGFGPANGMGGNGFGPANGMGGNGFGPSPSTNGMGGNGFGPANGMGGNGFGPSPSTNGSNGNGNGSANGFYGPRSNEMIPPLPQGPQGFAGPDGLPQRRNGEQPRPEGDSGYGPTIPRQLPSNPESQGRGGSVPSMPPISAPPYARPTSVPPANEPPVSGPPTSGAPVAPPAWPPAPERDQTAAPHVPESLAAALDMTAEIPRYRPGGVDQQPQVERPTNPQTAPIPSSAPPARPVSAAPVTGTPISSASPIDAQRAAAAARAAHEIAAAQAAEAQATAAAQIAAAQAAARQRDSAQGQFADETMELPIFRELESAWFTTAHPAEQKPAGDDGTAQRIPTGEPSRTVGVPQQAGPPESRDHDPAPVGVGAANGYGTSNGSGSTGGGVATNPWRTAADEGWQAARAAAEHTVDTTTTAGLPKRTPMAQLVPGGVDRGGDPAQKRTPEGVRGLLSAYHRGVQRGRTKEQSTNPEETPGGQQSSQAGKEHEA
ncbi:nitrate- and nitrite sensing domain-containing protein [Actinoplanes sp. KI2]|uniref:sensor histidine kinase n=1 Tax=Actinoplanes sp. KI2 TaxID=2983315 RepID=UPI0021D5FC3D|nr:nitrate- and nitrite sensing domain-containing protein [Actinoplanes sp. KI2]MCU7726741.1 nitrate- and nitrite sensing domain-containing protein [Actinoplanes sp. KI2]